MAWRSGDAIAPLDDFDLLPQQWSDTDQQIFEYLLQPQAPAHPVAPVAMGAISNGNTTSCSTASVTNSPDMRCPGVTTPVPKAPARSIDAAGISACTKAKKSSKANVGPKDCAGTTRQQKTGRGGRKRKATRKRTSAEERRLKHREVQRRFMERKKESIIRVKEAIAGLESQVRLLKLTSEKETLEQENDLLQHHLTGESANVNNLEQLKALLEAEKKLVESSFEPVTPQRWRELVDKTMKETDAQVCDPSFRSMGFSVLGWSDRRKIEDATVKFTFSKFFPHIWAEELLNKTWDKVTTESYSSFFSPSLYITIHLLQRVSNDAIIVYRAICNPHTNRISRSVELIGRIRRERDFVLFICSFDGAHNVHRCVGEAQSWSRSMTILRFEPTSMHQTSPGCTMHFGGAYANLATAGVQHWLMEVLFIVLRFESVMIAPMFAICAS